VNDENRRVEAAIVRFGPTRSLGQISGSCTASSHRLARL